MIVTYFDSSALVKLVLPELGTEEARAVWDVTGSCVTSWLTSAETAAALGAAHRSKRLSRSGFRRSMDLLDQAESGMVHVRVTESVARLAAELAVRHSLRGADAVHLASALLIGGDPVFACWDERLRRGAAAEGLILAPAVVDGA